MLSTNVGGVPGLGLILREQLWLMVLEHEKEHEEKATTVRGVHWLRDSLSAPKTASGGAPPEVDTWTCPRCRSHRCIRINPGNVSEPVYCCSVCGYRFHKPSAMRLPDHELLRPTRTRSTGSNSARLGGQATHTSSPWIPCS